MTPPREHLDRWLGELGRSLAVRRAEKRMSQAALAAASGVSKRTVERVEAGRSIQSAHLIQIFDALGLADAVRAALAPIDPPASIGAARNTRPTDTPHAAPTSVSTALPTSPPPRSMNDWPW